MRIGFVAEPYEEKNASGMGHVIVELMRNLPLQGARHEFVFYSSTPLNRTLVSSTYTNVIIPRHFLRKLWYFFTLREKPDVLIFMVPMMPLIVRGIKAVPMCQELASQKIRPKGLLHQIFAFVRDHILMRFSLGRASKILAASKATQTDLMRFYKIPADRIVVSYDGFQDLRKYAEDAPTIDPKLEPFFFFAGKVKYRKNVHGIVSAFIAFKERTKVECKLVIAGEYGGEYYESIMRDIRARTATDDIVFIGYTTAGSLYAHYTRALACLFPSLNEGFGMPILEAMSLGTPVITSNISSMTEVAGGAALLVDPHDTNDISRAMERIFSDEPLRRELAKKGKERAQEFSWPKAAREYIALAERI